MIGWSISSYFLGVDKRGEAGDDGERGVARMDRSGVAGVQLDIVVVGVRSVRKVASVVGARTCVVGVDGIG